MSDLEAGEPGQACSQKSEQALITNVDNLRQGPESRITRALAQTRVQESRVLARVSMIKIQLRGHPKFRVNQYCTAQVLGTYTSQLILTLKLETGYYHHYL